MGCFGCGREIPDRRRIARAGVNSRVRARPVCRRRVGATRGAAGVPGCPRCRPRVFDRRANPRSCVAHHVVQGPLHLRADVFSYRGRVGMGRGGHGREYTQSNRIGQRHVRGPRSDRDPPWKRQCDREPLETTPRWQSERSRDEATFAENDGTAVSPRSDERHDRGPAALRHPYESRTRAEHDLVAPAIVAIGIEVSAGINEHRSTRFEHTANIVRACTETAECLQQAPERQKVTHRKIVRECVEGCRGTEVLPKRRDRTGQIRSTDPAIVIGDEHRRRARDMFETLDFQTEIVFGERTKPRQPTLDDGDIPAIEVIGVERSHARAVQSRPRPAS